MSRWNATYWSKLGEMGVGKMGVGKRSIVTDHHAVFFHSYTVMYSNENSHHKIFMEPVSEYKPREDAGMSKGSSRQHGGLCLRGHQVSIPGCPRDPPDSLGACVWGDTKGGSRDVQGILRTGWGSVSEGTPREDPGMSKGSSRQHGGLCLRGHQGRIPGCPGDPPDSMGACVWGNTKGRSRNVQGILRTVWTPVGNTGHPSTWHYWSFPLCIFMFLPLRPTCLRQQTTVYIRLIHPVSEAQWHQTVSVLCIIPHEMVLQNVLFI